MELYIVTYKNASYAVAAYNKLLGYGVRNVRMSQTPFAIKGECDLCIKAYGENALDIVLNESRGKYPVNNVYLETNMDGKTVYKLIP